MALQALAWRREKDPVGWTHTDTHMYSIHTKCRGKRKIKETMTQINYIKHCVFSLEESNDETKSDSQSSEEKRENKV